MEAISHAGTVLGVLAKDGVVLAAEKKVTGKLLDLSGAKEGGYGGSGEKIFLLNSCVVYSILSFAVSSFIVETSSVVLLVLQRMLIRSLTTHAPRHSDICIRTTRTYQSNSLHKDCVI